MHASCDRVLHRGLRWCAALLLFCGWALAWPQQVAAQSSAIRVAPGASSFAFIDDKGNPSRQITVYTYLPVALKANLAPIVFVMHGAGKAARRYRDEWIKHADKHGFMVIAPLFDAQQWGGGEYSYASVVGKDGKSQDVSLWSFSLIEHLFDGIKSATGNQAASYFIYGHSEGGQFVHRLALLLPDARYARAVAANPGWYTMPRFDVKFPYGLGASPVTEASLKRSLARDFVLMLGDQDTDPNHPQLRRTAGAMAQGTQRFERGQNYFVEAKARATQMQSAFGWQLRVVPNAGHANSAMSGPAAVVLMGR